MNQTYHHTQIGYITSIGLLVGLMATFLGAVVSGFNIVSVLVCILMAVCLLLFSNLTVEITDNVLIVLYGPKILSKKFPLNEIKSVQVVRQPWYYGWGMRRTQEGWLYRVSGFYAVRIENKNGKIFFAGSDEAETLKIAIEQQMSTPNQIK